MRGSQCDGRLTRRALFRSGGGAAAAMLLGPTAGCAPPPPAFLGRHQAAYRRDPRQARLAWFTEARFGLFMHYGLYSLLGRGEWVMYQERIPVAEYARLKDRFTAEAFDADRITDLALAAGMRYVNLTSRHHDSFCLFRTTATDFNSVSGPARRDLVGELADACRRKRLGLFLYYSYAADWRHPYFFPRGEGRNACSIARPPYPRPDPAYLFRQDSDFQQYVDFVHHQLRELLTQYGPLAGIWFDPIMGYYCRPELFPIAETYALIRSLQPGCLISFKQGATGDEDFAAPERRAAGLDRGGEIARRAWERNRGKPIEICDTLQPKKWGYDRSADGRHKTVDDVIAMLEAASQKNASLLLNTGPLSDGSIHPEDAATLAETGRRRRA